MSMKHCKECGVAISSKAPACVSCGAPQASGRLGVNVIGCLLFTILAAVLWAVWQIQGMERR